MKNLSTLDGTWTEKKAKLKQKFAILNDRDLVFEDGKQDELLLRLQKTIGGTREELIKIIEEI